MLELIMTPQDLKQIGNLIDTKLSEQTKRLGARLDKQDKSIDAKFDEQDKKLDVRFDKQDKKFDAKLGGLEIRIGVEFDKKLGELEQKMFEWRSDVMNSVDALAKEIHDESEFREIASQQIEENRERTDRLEKKVFGVVVG